MYLEKKYTKNSAGETLWSGIRLAKLAEVRRHHFSPKLLELYEGRGFITRTDSMITLHTVDGDMRFAVDHVPGRYCLHCGEALTSEEDKGTHPQGSPELGKAARAHVEAKHKGEQSPDPRHPAGYKYKHYYGATAAEDVPTLNPKSEQFNLKQTGE